MNSSSTLDLLVSLISHKHLKQADETSWLLQEDQWLESIDEGQTG
jgi:hypothetical protein